MACSSNYHKGDGSSLPLFPPDTPRPLTPNGRCDIEEKRKHQCELRGKSLLTYRGWLYLLYSSEEGWLLAGMLSGYQGSCPLEGAPSQCLIAIFVLLGRGVPGLGTRVWSPAKYCCSQAACIWDYILRWWGFCLSSFKASSIKDAYSIRTSEPLSVLPLWLTMGSNLDTSLPSKQTYWSEMFITLGFSLLYMSMFTLCAGTVFLKIIRGQFFPLTLTNLWDF